MTDRQDIIDAATFGRPACHFCGNGSAPMYVPTDRGLICNACMQVAVEMMMQQHDVALRKFAKKTRFRVAA